MNLSFFVFWLEVWSQGFLISSSSLNKGARRKPASELSETNHGDGYLPNVHVVYFIPSAMTRHGFQCKVMQGFLKSFKNNFNAQVVNVVVKKK